MAYDTYCALIATKHTFGDKYDIDVDLGEQSDSTFRDTLKAFTSEIDALNYMAAKGWELVSSSANVNLYLARHILRKKA